MDAAQDYNILLVEDDAAFGIEFADYLTSVGISVLTADSFSKIRDVYLENINLVILDQFVRGHDAIHFLPLLKTFYKGPVIFLTNNAEQTDRVVSLELGADDFIHKTQPPREILARIRAVIRRSRNTPDQGVGGHHLGFGPPGTNAPLQRNLEVSTWRIDAEKRALFTPNGTDVRLTGAEFDALQFMAGRKGQVVTREDLFLGILGRPQSGVFDRTIDNLLSRLRRTLITYHPMSGALFKSVRGKGYIFVGFDDHSSDVPVSDNHHAPPTDVPPASAH